MINERRMADLEREVKRLRQELIQRPIKPPKGSSATVTYHLQIIDGQTVYSSGATTYYGIKRKTPAISTVVALYDPSQATYPNTGDFVAADGIGRATLLANGVSQGVVLVVHDNRTGSIITTALATGDIVATVASVSLPLASDATQSVTAYLPLFV